MSIIVDKAEQRYQDLVKKIAEQRTNAEADNLSRYHVTGGMIDDLLSSQETRRYGTRTIDNLVDDLKKLPEFADVLDVKRFLYWSLALHKTWTQDELNELAAIGFTVSHAKALLALSDRIRPLVAERMIADGRVVPSRKLTDVIKEVCRERLTTEDAAKTGAEAPPEAASVADVAELPQAEVAKPPVLTTPPVIEAPKPKEKPKADKPEAPPAKVADTPTSPLKPMKSADKLLTKLMAEIPEVFIAIKETGKRGFDSDKAQQNYEKLLGELSAGIRDVLEPLAELLKEIDDQRGTGG